MNTTPVVTSAIDALNAAKQKDAELEAGLLIGYILAEQATIARYESEIKLHREELDKVAHDIINVDTVTGHPAPATPNVSEITIGKTIAKLNEDKQKGVEVIATRLSAAVSDKQASIKACQTRIAELQKKLSEIQPAVVTPTTIMGS